MGFVIEDVQEGTGKTAQKGKDITVHYTGYLTDGTVFDSSVSRGQPLTITLGVGQVIRGWDEGFDGMKEGGKRKLTIPPEMGVSARTLCHYFAIILSVRHDKKNAKRVNNTTIQKPALMAGLNYRCYSDFDQLAGLSQSKLL